jgi:hypothetical protein
LKQEWSVVGRQESPWSGDGHLSAVSEPDSSFYIRNFLASHLVHISNVARREKASARRIRAGSIPPLIRKTG